MKFIQDEIEKTEMNQEVQDNPTFMNCFRKDLTKPFTKNLQKRMKGRIKDHVILFIYGETGTFKSSVAQEIARIIDPNFKAEQIVFTDPELETIMKTSKPGQCFIRDESPPTHGYGSTRIVNQIQLVAETLRMRQNSIIFISPEFERITTAHFYLRTIDKTEDLQYVRVGIQKPLTEKYLGSLTVKIQHNNPIWNVYNERKKAFLERVVKQELKTTDLKGLAQEFMKMDVYQEISSIGDLKLYVNQVYGNLTITEQKFVEQWVRKLSKDDFKTKLQNSYQEMAKQVMEHKNWTRVRTIKGLKGILHELWPQKTDEEKRRILETIEMIDPLFDAAYVD